MLAAFERTGLGWLRRQIRGLGDDVSLINLLALSPRSWPLRRRPKASLAPSVTPAMSSRSAGELLSGR
jgi:hypothetical protein